MSIELFSAVDQESAIRTRKARGYRGWSMRPCYDVYRDGMLCEAYPASYHR
jgi:hypothetical protein